MNHVGSGWVQEADHTETQEEVPAVPQAYNKDDFFDVLSSDLQDRLNTSEPKRRPFSEQRKVHLLPLSKSQTCMDCCRKHMTGMWTSP